MGSGVLGIFNVKRLSFVTGRNWMTEGLQIYILFMVRRGTETFVM